MGVAGPGPWYSKHTYIYIDAGQKWTPAVNYLGAQHAGGAGGGGRLCRYNVQI